MAGYAWADVGTARLPFDQFVSFVMHAPPGTAVFNERHQGWTVTDYLLVDALELLDVLLCTKTKDPKKAINRLKPRWRPGQKTVKQLKQDTTAMTVEEYVKRTGMKIELEGR